MEQWKFVFPGYRLLLAWCKSKSNPVSEFFFVSDTGNGSICFPGIFIFYMGIIRFIFVSREYLFFICVL